MQVDRNRSLVLVIDEQPSFMKGIHEADRVFRRSEFLLRIAQLLEIPIFASEQYPLRMGSISETILPFVSEGCVFPKMSFSCCGEPSLMEALNGGDWNQAILVGIETHICVSQTAHDLLASGWEVFVAADAVSARSLDRHEVGLERLRAARATVVHTESVAYEWMGSAEHPRFREVLDVVKRLS